MRKLNEISRKAKTYNDIIKSHEKTKDERYA